MHSIRLVHRWQACTGAQWGMHPKLGHTCTRRARPSGAPLPPPHPRRPRRTQRRCARSGASWRCSSRRSSTSGASASWRWQAAVSREGHFVGCCAEVAGGRWHCRSAWRKYLMLLVGACGDCGSVASCWHELLPPMCAASLQVALVPALPRAPAPARGWAPAPVCWTTSPGPSTCASWR